MTDIIKIVTKTIHEHNLICDVRRVIIALSGGADSVCLFHIFRGICAARGIELCCAHVNHNLRGHESDRDEEFVTQLARQYNIQIFKKHIDVKSFAIDRGLSIEQGARELRYNFFSELLEQGDVLATAHNQNDNAETFLINAIRGSGIRGLCGIPYQRGQIIRPMLDIRREQVLEFLEAGGYRYVTDSSNTDRTYLRNLIRCDILPVLKEREDINIISSIAKTIANLNSENEYFESLAREHTNFSKQALAALPPALLFRVLTIKLEREHGISLNKIHFKNIQTMISGTKHGAKTQIKGNLYACLNKSVLKYEVLEQKTADLPMLLQEGVNIYRGKKIFLTKKTEVVYSNVTKSFVDCDKINGSQIYVRLKSEGDRFSCIARQSTSRLKKLLINDKVAAYERDNLLVFCDCDDNIVFVEGYGASALFCADSQTKNAIAIDIEVS